MEDAQLQVALLGKPQFKRKGQPLDLTSVKGQALLAYLAATRQPHSRSALAGLLWSDSPEEVARTNLRATLSQLRKVVGDIVLGTRRTVELNPDSHIWLDIALLEHAASSGNDLATAANLYRGDFLDDFYVPEAELFEEWLLVERERLRQLALSVLGQLADIALEQGDYATGIRAARQLLSIEPWHEAGHRQLITLLAADGQVSTALAQFESCKRMLAEELGIEPSTETATLVEAIRSGKWRAPQAVRVETVASDPLVEPSGLPPHNLVAATTLFVGRQVEQTKIADLLAEPDCRLLTIIGPGGMGKTRLAQAVAFNQLKLNTPFQDGIYFVPLRSVTPANSTTGPSSNPVVLAIGAALGLPFSGSISPQTQLLNALREKSRLLVLDNFEHLLDHAGLVVEMLRQASGLKVIVTSRQSLNFVEEWIFDLGGLSYPAVGDSATFEDFESVQLFAQRAQQVAPNFDSATELPQVSRICRLLGGMPLGIELAAAWVRALPCHEIIHQIERNLDFLESKTRNVPKRQRSLRAVFDYSWQMLEPREQEVFTRLSVFSGGFTTEAAIEVAGASYVLLSNLVDKSLLQRTEAGRYGLHELLRQYGAEKLAEVASLRANHAHFFATLHHQQEEALINGEATAIVIATAEIDNLQAAWQWAIAQANEAVLEQLLSTLVTFYTAQGWFQEGQTRLAEAIQVIEPDNLLLCGRLEEGLARFCDYLGDFAQAKLHAEKSLNLFERARAPGHVANAQALLGFILSSLGENMAAKQYLEESLTTFEALNHIRGQAAAFYYLSFVATGLGDLTEGLRCVEAGLECYRQLGDRRNMAEGLYLLGNFQIGFGDYVQALAYYAESKALHQELSNRVGLAHCLRNEGLAALFLGRLREAEQAAQASLKLCTEFGDQYSIARNLFNLGRAATDRTDYQQARRYLEESLVQFQAVGNLVRAAHTRGFLGGVMAALNDLDAAKANFRQALELSMSTQAILHTLEIFPQMTDFLVRQDLASLAVEMLAHAVHNPVTEAFARGLAQQELKKLGPTMPPNTFAQLEARGKDKSLEEIVTALLAAMWDETLGQEMATKWKKIS